MTDPLLVLRQLLEGLQVYSAGAAGNMPPSRGPAVVGEGVMQPAGAPSPQSARRQGLPLLPELTLTGPGNKANSSAVSTHIGCAAGAGR